MENASLLKYDVENCNKTVSAFLDVEAYSLIEIQKASRDNSLYFIINPISVDTGVSYSSSVNVKLNSVIVSTKRFLIQSYCAVSSDEKQKLNFSSKIDECSILLAEFQLQVLLSNGKIFRLLSITVLFQICSFL